MRTAQGRYAEAQRIYREALRFWPDSLEVAVNLAELYRVQTREHEAEVLLQDAARRHPNDAIVLQALAFSLIRQQRKSDAIALLERAEDGAGSAELSYLFGLALIDDGQQQNGMRILEKALVRAPGDRDLLLALASQAQASGASDQARRYLQRLAAINPDDPALMRVQ